MKVFKITISVCLIIAVLALYVWAIIDQTQKREKEESAFTLIESQQISTRSRMEIYVHNDTGVMYCMQTDAKVLVIMVDADGNPLIYGKE